MRWRWSAGAARRTSSSAGIDATGSTCSTWRSAVPVVIALLALQAVLVVLFVVPGRTPEPHGLPVGVAGPAAAQVQRALEARGSAFEVRTYADAETARNAIRSREIYGAVVPAEGRVLVASAASPVVAQVLGQELGRGATARGASGAPASPDGARTEDVVPLASGDPRGVALNLRAHGAAYERYRAEVPGWWPRRSLTAGRGPPGPLRS